MRSHQEVLESLNTGQMLAYRSQNLFNICTSWYSVAPSRLLKRVTNDETGYSVVTDLICAVLPVFVLYDIKIALKDKIGICGLMSMGLVATAAAIVRASSLGTKTVDLSYDYCIAAIWANTELHLGIIATNLALGRMIWKFFAGGARLPISETSRYGAPSTLGKSRSEYTRNEDRRPTQNRREDPTRSLENLSQESQIPLESMIKKTTRVTVSRRASQDRDELIDALPRWNNQGKPVVY
jgi:hypothetical protein